MPRGRIVLVCAVLTAVVIGAGTWVVIAAQARSGQASADAVAPAAANGTSPATAGSVNPVTVPDLTTPALSSVSSGASAAGSAESAPSSTPSNFESTTGSTPAAPVPTGSTDATATTPTSTGSRSANHKAKQAPATTSASEAAASATTPKPATPQPTTSAPAPKQTTSATSSTKPVGWVSPALPPLAKTTGSADDIADAVEQQVQAAADQGVDEHVMVMNRQTGAVIYSHDSATAVPSMSLVKAFVAADVLTRNGGINALDAATQQRMWKMITASDDEVMQDFWDADGGNAIVERVIEKYDLEQTSPTAGDRYWGDVQITAADEAKFLREVMADPLVGPWLQSAMRSAVDTADDGYDQNMGVNAVTGTGSKQGWGCCLGGVMTIHSMGFSANEIVVVLSTSAPDVSYTQLGTAQDLMDDAGAQTASEAITRTARAALSTS